MISNCKLSTYNHIACLFGVLPAILLTGPVAAAPASGS